MVFIIHTTILHLTINSTFGTAGIRDKPAININSGSSSGYIHTWVL